MPRLRCEMAMSSSATCNLNERTSIPASVAEVPVPEPDAAFEGAAEFAEPEPEVLEAELVGEPAGEVLKPETATPAPEAAAEVAAPADVAEDLGLAEDLRSVAEALEEPLARETAELADNTLRLGPLSNEGRLITTRWPR